MIGYGRTAYRGSFAKCGARLSICSCVSLVIMDCLHKKLSTAVAIMVAMALDWNVHVLNLAY